MDSAVEGFLRGKKLFLVEKIDRGHSSLVFLLKDLKGRKIVAKIERPDSTRFKMAEREAENLKKANSVGVGPRLLGKDLKRRLILMEFVEGRPFSEWLFSGPGKKELKQFVESLEKQAKALDNLGLDHGQLAGRGKNILVREGKPVIIDFEKASSNRKCHNLSVVRGFLFKNPNGTIAKKVKKILGQEAKSLAS
jgi:predicted Ser/Thr protein kinase